MTAEDERAWLGRPAAGFPIGARVVVRPTGPRLQVGMVGTVRPPEPHGLRGTYVLVDLAPRHGRFGGRYLIAPAHLARLGDGEGGADG